ncbi:MAG TPA: hypothetical protein VGR28_07600 [Candidatus Thermoplasmatota archaeon]|jgi:hypothetical protein|nr:hypothetical protein [Candidatus Thermoplasmatota archaeon]
MTTRPPDYHDVVRRARLRTRVFLVAQTPPCIRLRDEAARPRGRDYHTALLGDLHALKLPARWLLAVILCPGNGTEALAAWLRQHDADPDRVMFVLHPATDAVAALTGWYAAGFGDPVACEARTLKEFAKPLGQFVNDWIYADEQGSGYAL